EKVHLKVIERGKKPGEPHSYDYRGWCLLPVSGYFLSVVEGGSARRGDRVKIL
ncbi:MAG: MOSC domain-containing protein, partial [Synergistaceae bacterium]|nr:MOSC domain-containing protein [Synergistaceae bacterium]